MKKNNLIAAFITIVITCVCTNLIQAQISLETNSTDFWGSLDFNIGTPPNALGVGDFRNGVQQPLSALHVNTINYTPSFFNG